MSDVNVWLSEDNVACQCPKCKAVNPYVLQTQVIVRAWQSAKRVKPDLRLRLLLTQGSYASNDKVLAAAPREVGITYYDGGRTYDSSRQPMIYPLLEKYAAEGRWLGCYPQLTASWRIVAPWSGPQFIKARMSEFVDKRLQCLCGYATPSNRFYEFNVTAAAGVVVERRTGGASGISPWPGPPARDWPIPRRPPTGPSCWGRWAGTSTGAARCSIGSTMASPKSSKPESGPSWVHGHFVYFPSKEHFDADLATCDRAMRLAEGLRSPAMIEETHVIRGLVGMLKGLYLMAEATAAGKKMTAADRQRAADCPQPARSGKPRGPRRFAGLG